MYVDDGTGFTPDTQAYASDNLNGASSSGDFFIIIDDASDFPNSGTIYIESEGANTAEIVAYTGKGFSNSNKLTLISALTSNHADNALVFLVDVVNLYTEAGQRRFRLHSFPVVRNSEIIKVKKPGGVWTTLVPTTDYVLNRGTGEFIIVDSAGLLLGSQLVCSLTYYTNLISEVQRVLEGDVTNSAAYPGVKAAGIHLSVEAPITKRISISLSITAEDGYREADLVTAVQVAVEAYVNSRKIGEDVLWSKIVQAASNVTGVSSVRVITPLGDVIVLENERPLAVDAVGVSLVTVY